jgi:predicted transcriptional regulator YdeE
MKAEVVEIEGFTVAGVSATFTEDEEHVGELWQKYGSRAEELESIAIDPRAFGVALNTGTKGEWSYLAGKSISPDKADAVPEGFDCRYVQGGRFAYVETTMEKMDEAFAYIDKEWLPSSTFERDQSGPTLDVYRIDKSGNHVVCLYVPIK